MKYRDLIDRLKDYRTETRTAVAAPANSDYQKELLSPKLRQLMEKYSSPAKMQPKSTCAPEIPFEDYKAFADRYQRVEAPKNKYSSAGESRADHKPVGTSNPSQKRHTVDTQSPAFKSLRTSALFQEKGNRLDSRASCYLNSREFLRTASHFKQRDDFPKEEAKSWITERNSGSPLPKSFRFNKQNGQVKNELKQQETKVSLPIQPPTLRKEGTTRKLSTFREAANSSSQQRNRSSTNMAPHQMEPNEYGLAKIEGSRRPSQPQCQQLSKSEFEVGKCKGDGKFGRVYPCRHRLTGTIYALKQIPKELLSRHMMEDQMLREIKLHYCFNHNNIVKLYGFFSDYMNVYLLMEYMEDGTLYHLLKKKQKLPEGYVADRMREICSAVSYLHRLGVAHRDIKLQNIVLSNGVAKLCDFGWAAMTDCRRTTYCGTFDYVPPEILEGKDYNEKVDMWSIGVLAYELIAGKVPFYHISRNETITNIINVDQRGIQYPAQMSLEAKDFISKLLRKNPAERLTSDELLKHPFLQTVVEEEPRG